MGKLPKTQQPLPLIKAVTKIAAPLIRLLLHFQITFPVLSQILKQVYVTIAEKEFGIDNKPPTDSRISLLTGVHRREIRRLRNNPGPEQNTPTIVSMGTQMIGTWLADPQYLDESGQPKPLPKTLPKSDGSTSDKRVSFEQLVTTVAKQDIRPKVVLDEWLRLGIVEVIEGCVVLNTAAFIPQQGFDEKALFFGKNLHDHVAASAHNLLGGQPPQFDRAVFYNNLSKDDIAILEEMINERASALLVEVNRQAKSLQEMSREHPGANYRFNLGTYFWVAEQPIWQEGEQEEKDGQI